jgi:hypothetical protein
MTAADSALELQRATEMALVRAVEAEVISIEEAGTAAALAAKVISQRGLTADDARVAWRILNRHQSQLMRLGLEVPGIPVPPPVDRDTPDNPQPVLAMRRDGRIGVHGAMFAIKETLKTVLHARWDSAAKQWHVAASPAYAAGLLAVLREYDPAVSPRVQELADEHMRRAAARSVLDPSNPVPELDLSRIATPGAKAWEHQARGVEFCTAATGALLAVPMGGGKSAMAVWTTNRVRAQRVIIVCPNKVRGVWPREVMRWSASPWHIVDGRRPAKRKGAKPQDLKVPERIEQAEACLFDCTCGAVVHAAVMNYEMLSHPFMSGQGETGFWKPPFPVDMVIYDEAHRLKSGTGITSKTAAKWVDFSKRRLALTGTPMPQRPTDIFGMYRALEPGIFGPVWTPFKNEYALERETRDGRKFIVGIQPDRLHDFAVKVHSIMYRPTVDLKLPGRSDLTREIELEPAAAREYKRLDEEMLADLTAFAQGEADASADALTPKNILSRAMRLAQFTGGTVPNDAYVASKGKDGALVRVSHAKANGLAEILEEVGCVPDDPASGKVRDPEPVVVYCQYSADLAAVREVAEGAGLRYAEVSGKRSDGLTEASEMNPRADVVGVQIQSGGTGVDLTRSRYSVWYSVGHSLGDYDQARHRQDRPGQKRPVVNIHLVVPGTVDEDIRQALTERRSVVSMVLKRRGLNPADFGESDKVLSGDPFAVDVVGRHGGAVVLPIDEFGADVMAPRRAAGHGHFEQEPDVPAAELAALGLDF